jgi:ATP-dependent RNA/DNA helicase IGHMBP2
VPKIVWSNKDLNEFQQDAVKRALAAEDVALVHGPPGTGKTTVLVEIIRQHAARGERMLATAPSNIAVDNMLEKLLPTGLRVVRLGHPARTLESLRHGNLAYQLEADPAYIEVQELDRLRERLIKKESVHGRGYRQLGYDEQQKREREVGRLWRQARDLEEEISRRIVASAQVVLGTHAGLSKRFVKGDFDLVAMDEASQATEPLSWVPLCLARKAVFAGDSNQLPPTIYSKEAAQQGLQVTLFDRLKDILPQTVQTLLRVQYRMHEDIMRYSSDRFYEGKLIAHESVARHTAAELEGVQPTDLTSRPVTYVDTAGAGFDESWNEMLESRENKGEAGLAVKLYNLLREAGLRNKDIALLTPYVAQARLLKTLLREPGLEIGSVDGFQGREKEAVIVSLVRSNESGQVGFLSDLRRLNVALTRARRLLIVIGDSATISRHADYEAFIAHADKLDSHRSAYEWIGG